MNIKSHLSYRRKIQIIVSLMLFFQTEVMAMSIFEKKICVFSALEGTVVKNGQLIENAIIKRTYTWDGEDHTDEIKTDENGYFSFPNQYERSTWALFPHNPSIIQFVKVYLEGKEYQAWGFQKNNYDVNGELDGAPMNLFCDLDAPSKTYKVNEYKNYVGICVIK